MFIKRVPIVLGLSLVLLVAKPAHSDAPPMKQAARAARTHAQIFAALAMPIAALELYRAGMPLPEIRVVLEEGKDRRTPPWELTPTFRVATAVTKEGQPPKNFGAYVNDQLASGLRGQALADSIHHAKRRGNYEVHKGPKIRNLRPIKGKPPTLQGGPGAGNGAMKSPGSSRGNAPSPRVFKPMPKPTAISNDPSKGNDKGKDKEKGSDTAKGRGH